ncbi:RHO alpha subunit C-terminal catalytic domain-containing protein [Nitrospirillum iridis]|uniref:Phenylpropionate dioxygenase-like ring-hydroxylating dioxygenase large terminal subunit n=1 Tax=Nitrospirillum iridis TaxID=765888 RepID=A0A7X0ECY8_9PROT|nr:RHO alpha subunit C-terminal catalytic domain-containing protein [Nitrospirillum iridis]MBB6252252.1 phenylpropionate dioxygenase-like ring-hydroxylating dioxygenase large terminal subunit [Nitrospirillum iridis]
MLPAAWFAEPARFTQELAALRRQWLYVGTVFDAPLARTVLGTPIALAADLTATDDEGRRVETATCGAFVFARLTAPPDGGPRLVDHLGPVADHLARLSGQCDQAIAADDLDFAANWKVLVENTMDDFHGSTVHPTTIHPAVHADWQTHLATTRFGRHSLSSWLLSDETETWWRRIDAKAGLRRVTNHARYDHCFVFPNLYVASFYGAMVVVHTVEPLAVDRSRLDWRLFLPVTAPERPAVSAFRRSLSTVIAASARAVILEDRPLCERVQRARGAALGPGILGRRERRIADFHHAWARALGLDTPPPPADAPYEEGPPVGMRTWV